MLREWREEKKKPKRHKLNFGWMVFNCQKINSYKNDRPLIALCALSSLWYVCFVVVVFFSFRSSQPGDNFSLFFCPVSIQFTLFFCSLSLSICFRWSSANGVTIAPVLVIVHSFINIVFTLMESFCMTTSFLLRCYCCCSLLSLYTFPLDDFLSLNSLYFRNDAHFSPPMDFNSLRMNWRIIICMHTTV